MNETLGTEPQFAPVPRPVTPREMKLSPRGTSSEPYSRRFPEVRGGTCEFCGVIDQNQPGQYQYKLCPHYRGMDLRCVYCPQTKDQEEVVRNSILNVAEDPYSPGNLVVWCGSFECSRKHEQRYKRSA